MVVFVGQRNSFDPGAGVATRSAFARAISRFVAMPDLSRLSVSSPATQTPEAAVALQNHLRHTHVLRPGLHVHADDLVDAQDFTASGQIEQGLRLSLIHI